MYLFTLLNYISSNLNLIIGAICAILGMIFGHWSAVNLWQKQIKHMQKNVAFGFLIELEVLEKWFNNYLDELNKIEDVNMGSEEERNLIKNFKYSQFFNNEIYSDIGTWNILKEKVYELPTDLCQNLDIFYSYVLSAERMREIFTEQSTIQNRDLIIEQLKIANDLIPKLRVLLEETANRK